MQWKQLLLLMLRCAIPVLLALAMARPLLHSLLSADGQSALSLAIVIDDSMSMFAAEPSASRTGPTTAPTTAPTTRFSLACQSAVELLDGLPAGSNAKLILGGSMPDALQDQIPDVLASKIRSLGQRLVPAGVFVFQKSMQRSLDWLSNSSNPRRQVVLISDFQKHEWSGALAGPISETAKLVAGQSVPTSLSFLRIGTSQEPGDLVLTNLSIDSIDVFPKQLAIERDSSISVTIGNHGTTKSDRVQVVVLVNGVEIDRQHVAIEAASTTQLRISWIPTQIGDHILDAKILHDDVLIADNVLSMVAIVQDPIPILLVDGDLRNEPMQSEADFLRLALSPFSLLGGKKGDAFLSKTIALEQLTETMLKDFRAVCLCNVREVSESQQRWLRSSIEQGSGLLVFLGDKVNTDHYQRWQPLANNGLRISSFSPREKISVDLEKSNSEKLDADSDSSPGSRVRMQQIEFPPIREMSSVSLSSLESVRFDHRVPMQLDASSLTNANEASVAMRFEDGQAFMLESRIGKGRCLWVSSSCDDDDSNLPTRSIFVPLVQKLAAYVSRAESQSVCLTTNELWTRSTGQLSSGILPPKTSWTVTKPDGLEVSVTLSDEGQLRYSDTRLLGTYVARPIKEVAKAIGAPSEKALDQWAVCVRSKTAQLGTESDLSNLTNDEIRTLAALGNATVSSSATEFLEQSRSDWHGREAWTWIWVVLVVCFLAELAIEQSLAPRSRAKLNSVASQVPRGTSA